MSEMAFIAMYTTFFRLVIQTHERVPESTARVARTTVRGPFVRISRRTRRKANRNMLRIIMLDTSVLKIGEFPKRWPTLSGMICKRERMQLRWEQF